MPQLSLFVRGFRAFFGRFVGHPISLAEPAAKVDPFTALAAKRQELAAFGVESFTANRTLNQMHDGKAIVARGN